MGFNWSRWKAKLWKSGIFLEGKSIVDKFISQFQRSVVEKKKNRISCEGTIATIHRLDEREVEVFEANSSLDIGSPPLDFSAKSIFVDGRQNSGEEGEI